MKPIHLETKIPNDLQISRGGGSWPLQIDNNDRWAYADDLFSNEQLDAIIRIGESCDLHQASTYGSNSPRVRKSSISFLYPNPFTYWIFQKLTDATVAINQQFFGFDLYELGQGLQFTRYDETGSHYDWHADAGKGIACRKLSLSLQLSDPQAYVGGDLQLRPESKPITVERKRGRVVFFPSYTLHRVTPIKSGIRHSLVAWVGGPPFK